MKILSIDPGESMIGYAITNNDVVVSWGHIKRKKCKRPSEIKKFIKQKMDNIMSQQSIDQVLIELHAGQYDNYRNDEKEIVDYFEQLNIPTISYQANEYLKYLKLVGYDKNINNLFKERQDKVFRYFRVKTHSKHNIDCLLMSIYFLENNGLFNKLKEA